MNKQISKKYKSLDLFAGVGGIRMGFEKAIIPALNLPQLEKFKGIKLRGISNIREALEEFK